MIPIHKMVFFLAHKVPTLHRSFMRLMIRGALRHPERYYQKLTERLCEQDKRVFQQQAVKHAFLRCSFEAARQGGDAAMHEQVIYINDRSVPFEDIQAPCVLWHGEEDRNIPFHLGMRLQERLPNAIVHPIEHAGHGIFYYKFTEVIQDINSRRERSQLVN